MKVYGFGDPVTVRCSGATITNNGGTVVSLTLPEGDNCSLRVQGTLTGDLVEVSGTLTRVDADDYTLTGMNATGGKFTGAPVVFDTTPPDVQSIALQGGPAGTATSVTYRVTFDENANNITTDDFELTSTGSASGTIASVSASSGTTVDVTVNSIAGGGTLRLDLKANTDIDDDEDNTPPAAFTGEVHTVTIDATPPSATSITLWTGGATSDTQIFRVVFDEDVANLSVDDFELFTTNTVSGTIASVSSPSGNNIDVTVNSVAGSGSMRLDIKANTDISDASGNGGGVNGSVAAFTGGQVIQIDRTGPALIRFARSNPTDRYTDADTLVWEIEFDENVLNLTADDFIGQGTTATLSVRDLGAAPQAPRDGSPRAAAPGSARWELTATGGDLAGLNADVLPIFHPGGTNITDTVGNPLPPGTQPSAASATYSVVNNANPPRIASRTRNSARLNNRTNLAWQIRFSEPVIGFSAADLELSGTSGVSFIVNNGDFGRNEFFVIFAQGGDLATVNGVVTLGFKAGHGMEDADGNALSNLTPTGTNEPDYELDHIIPSVALTTASPDPVSGAFSVTATFSEDVTGVALADFVVGNGAASNLQGSNAAYTVDITPAADGAVTVDMPAGAAQDLATNNNTAAAQLALTNDETAPTVALTTTSPDPVSGAFTVTATFSEDVAGFEVGDFTIGNGAASNFVTTSGSVYTALVTPAADGAVTVDVAANVATDTAGNGNVAAPQFTITNDQTRPTVAMSSSSPDPVSGAFTLTATFSEDVTGFDLTDLTIGNGAGSAFNAVSGSVYTALITPAADGPVTVDIAADAAIDDAGNGNVAATQFSITNDETPPTVALTTASTQPVPATFTLTATFSESVTGFELADFVVTNGAASDFNAVSDSEYTVTIAASADGDVTVDVAAGAANDLAGNASLAAAQFSIEADVTPPTAQINLPGATTTGPFQVSVVFSEDVTGFELADFGVTNGVASAFVATDARNYSATITPDTVGDVVINLAAGAAQDVAGNGSIANSGTVEAVVESTVINLAVTSDIVDASTVLGSATLNNPGSQGLNYTATADVNWITVTPATGTVPGAGSLDLTIGLNANVDRLMPGNYSGTVTISTGGAAPAEGSGGSLKAATTVVQIPVNISVAPRFGDIQIVSTTPSGYHREATFGLVSSDPDLNGQQLTTVSGHAQTQSFRKLFGQYDVTQIVPQGWEIRDITCTGDTDNGSVIDLANGRIDIDLDVNETIVCTFANQRDEDEVRLATMRAINNFMVRRGDRILSAAPDLSRRIRDRETTSPGRFSADINGGNRVMSMSTSLSGIRNHAKAQERQMPGMSDTRATGESSLDIWFSASYDAIDDNRAGDDAESSFGVVQIGADWLVDDHTVFGVMIQRDWMDEITNDISQRAGALRGARAQGSGWMAGPYMAWEFADGAYLDVLAMWGQSDNTVDPLGLYEDDFETSRYMIRANVSGEWSQDNWRVRPNAAIAHFEETQDAYTDKLGYVIPEQTVAIGRLEAGPEIAYRMEGENGNWWEPNASINAVWDYNAAGLMDENGVIVDTGGLRADASIGLRGNWHGAVISAEAQFGGLGEDDFSTNGARFEVRMPF